VFIYDANTFEKIEPIILDLEKGAMIIGDAYRDVEVDY
jgi:hypothetical protein